MNCKYNNCESCDYSKDCAIFKEYTELKEKIAQYDELSSELLGDGLGYIGLIKQAKEIIKELLDFDFLPDVEIKKKAEQFIEEV